MSEMYQMHQIVLNFVKIRTEHLEMNQTMWNVQIPQNIQKSLKFVEIYWYPPRRKKFTKNIQNVLIAKNYDLIMQEHTETHT